MAGSNGFIRSGALLARRLAQARFDSSKAKRAIIEPLQPGADGGRLGRPRLDDRRVPNAIFCVLRSSLPWRDVPERPPTTAGNRFNR